ncbi:MAG TPA: hypothetical protein VIQ31_36750 [Phormidium sp.]
MAVLVNTQKARVDKDGNLQRTKVKGYLPISLGYGIYLGESLDQRSDKFKAFFLMLSADATGNVNHPNQLLASPAHHGLSLDEVPFSKKFTVADNIIESLKVGSDYWFAYTSEAVSSVIDGKAITYESLVLIGADDVPGILGLDNLLVWLRLAKLPQRNS